MLRPSLLGAAAGLGLLRQPLLLREQAQLVGAAPVDPVGAADEPVGGIAGVEG